jgi:hypothetical protein
VHRLPLGSLLFLIACGAAETPAQPPPATAASSVPAPAPPPARPDVTLRYEIVVSARVAGDVVLVRHGDGSYDEDYQFTDRGRGPKLHVRTEVGEGSTLRRNKELRMTRPIWGTFCGQSSAWCVAVPPERHGAPLADALARALAAGDARAARVALASPVVSTPRGGDGEMGAAVAAGTSAPSSFTCACGIV